VIAFAGKELQIILKTLKNKRKEFVSVVCTGKAAWLAVHRLGYIVTVIVMVMRESVNWINRWGARDGNVGGQTSGIACQYPSPVTRHPSHVMTP
jgi:preprotein translocase subunit Sss1